MKRILKVAIVASLLVSINSFALYKEPLLVMDMSNAARLPKNFRTTNDNIHGDVNRTGLKDLHIAGGSQFSKLSFKKILNRLDEKKITIIDLRQESHGFLNSNAISWYAPNDAINAGKTIQVIEADQTQLLDDLNKQDIVDVFNIASKKNGYIAKARAKQYVVHQVMNEDQFAESAKQNYARIYVQDTYAPTNDEVDRFLEIVKAVPKDQWIYFHCRAGVGRTTTFMAMDDMLHNAKKVSFNDIIKRQHVLGGKDLEEPAKSDLKVKRTQERLAFLEKFYQYAKENTDNFATTWSQWLNSSS